MTLAVVTDWETVPVFVNIQDEIRFWQEHQVGQRLMQSSLVGTDTNESTTITLRMDPRMLARLKRLARSRYLNYQSMMKQWLSERMEQEVRER